MKEGLDKAREAYYKGEAYTAPYGSGGPDDPAQLFEGTDEWTLQHMKPGVASGTMWQAKQ